MKKKLSKSVSVLITSIIVLFLLPGDSLRLLSMYLRHYGLSENIIRYFSRMPASELFLMLISIFFIVLIIISIIKILILSYKLGANRSTGGTARPAAKVFAKPVAVSAARHVTEEAINCSHSTGKAKYLEQIDGYLKTGLIDRAEYNALKTRYERLNIPDDYHG